MGEIVTANGDRITPPHGLPARELLEKHDSDIAALRRSATSLANSVVELEEWRGAVMVEFAKVHTEIADLGTDVRRTLRPPPMRSEAPSGLDLLLEEADEIKVKAAEGERRPDTTPDEQVAPILLRLRDRKELADFRKAKAHAKGVALWLLGVVVTAIITAYVTLLVTGHQ